MSITDAFNSLLSMQARSMSLSRLNPAVSVNIGVAPTNYSRILAGPASTSIEGLEFIISNDALKSTTFPRPIRKKDRLIDPELGTLVIEEVIPMYSLGGEICGFRVRTG